MSESDTTGDASVRPATKPSKLLQFCQWLVLGVIIVLVSFSAAVEYTLDAPGAPVAEYWAMLAVGMAVAILNAPPIFFRLRNFFQEVAYGSILVYVGLALYVMSIASAAYDKTPEGKLAAEQRATEEEAAIAKKQREAKSRALQRRAETQAAKQRSADEAETFLAENPSLITGNNWSCRNLIDSVIAMSQDRPVQIYEITSPVEISNIPTFEIQCRGSAEWSNGSDNIYYGARISAGGKMIFEYQQGR